MSETKSSMPNNGTIAWKEGEQIHLAQWHSENSIPPHKRVVLVDDTLTADTAYRYACEGTAMLWKSDFQNARQLLQALATRIDKPSKKIKRDKEKSKSESRSILDNFNHHRLAQSQRARILGMLLIPLNADHSISLRRAPDVSQACLEAYGLANESYVISLRELLGSLVPTSGVREEFLFWLIKIKKYLFTLTMASFLLSVVNILN